MCRILRLALSRKARTTLVALLALLALNAPLAAQRSKTPGALFGGAPAPPPAKKGTPDER